MAAFTWYHSTQQAASGSTVVSILTDLVTLITANSGNAAASWQLASDGSASSPAYVTFKRKNGAAGRIMLFGGTTPNAAAVRQTTPANNLLYIGYAPTTTSDTPTTSYASGAPYTDWMIAASLGGANSSFRWNYSDADAGMVFHGSIQASGNTIGMAGPGLFEMRDGTVCPMVMGAGQSTGTWYVGSASMIVSTRTTNATANSLGQFVLFRRPSGSPADINVFRYFLLGDNNASSGNAFKDDTSSRRFFMPVLMSGPTDIQMGYAGKLRQMAFGIDGVCQFAMLAAGGGAEIARALSWNDSTANNALWLTQFEV